MVKTINIDGIPVGGNKPFALIAGPCVVEDPKTTLKIAASIQTITKRLKIPFIFKASYDKANRTSIESFRGLGMGKGLEILQDIKGRLGVPVLSDVHDASEVNEASQVLDVLQIPAFLCRQTDLLLAAAKTQKVINVKKGQFLAPWDTKSII